MSLSRRLDRLSRGVGVRIAAARAGVFQMRSGETAEQAESRAVREGRSGLLLAPTPMLLGEYERACSAQQDKAVRKVNEWRVTMGDDG
jgi:hypothetical protein